MSSDIPVKLIPPTPMVEKDSIPFPRTESQPTVALSAVHATAGPSNASGSGTNSSLGGGVPPAPQTTPEHSEHSSSSGTTTSELDQLTSLPISPASISPPRRFRSSTPGSNASTNRFRRSLDAVSTSLFSLSSSPVTRTPQMQPKSSPLIHSVRVCASERASPVRSGSPRSMQSTRGTRFSDPQLPALFRTRAKSLRSSRSPSNSPSRATSPLRRLHQWSSHLHRRGAAHPPAEEPFIPIDPFKLKSTFPSLPCFSSSSRTQQGDLEAFGTPNADCDILPRSSLENLYLMITDTLPRQVYLNLLLRLPAMYFSRVTRIFEDAEISKPDIVRMMEAGAGRIGEGAFFRLSTPPQPSSTFPSPQLPFASQSYPPGSRFPHIQPQPPGSTGLGIGLSAHVSTAAAVGGTLPYPEDWSSGSISPALCRFKQSWEAFVDSLLREWKTLNLTSALLASGILTTFQVPEMAEDPVTRSAALLSLICAIMSLSYGCIFILRFGTMRSLYKASRWAEEARKDYTLIWWNVWVLLAMPAVWLAWSMLLFLVSILSYIWRTGSVANPPVRAALGTKAILVPRIAITVVLGLGLVYMGMIIKTLRRYGSRAGVRGILGARAGSPPPFTGGTPSVPVGVGAARGQGEERRGRERERRAVRERTDRSRTTRREVDMTIRRKEDGASEKNVGQ